MTDLPDGPLTPGKTPRGRWQRLWSALQFAAALTATVCFLAYLLSTPTEAPLADAAPKAHQPREVVEVVWPDLLRVRKGGPLDRKLHPAVVRRQAITDPLMTVTGRVAASLRPTDGPGSEERWQFDSPEVLTAHTDWEKAKADIAFAQAQLEQVRLLAQARIDAQRKVVDRITRLVATGAEAEKDLALEKSTLLEVEVTARKDIHEAETAVRVARREEAATARQLQQAGLDPRLLRSVGAEVDIVMADVPEGLLAQVKIGQACRATFFGLPGVPFPGTVNSILPVLSREKRSLRVLLVIDDPDDKLRPGMFAEVGLGTDPREALLAPADGLLHIGRADYMLRAVGEDTWQVAEVQVGEPFNGEVEILAGLAEGDHVIGKGAILLKPLVVESLHRSPGDHAATGASE